MNKVVTESWRPVRTGFAWLGTLWWVCTLALLIAILAWLVWWLSWVVSVGIGVVMGTLAWWWLGSLRPRLTVTDAELIATGWLWRPDITIDRTAIHRLQPVDFYDPRVGGILWAQAGSPRLFQLEVTLVDGSALELHSTFAPHRISLRQAWYVTTWADEAKADPLTLYSPTVIRKETRPVPAWLRSWRTVLACGTAVVAVVVVSNIAVELQLVSVPFAQWTSSVVAAAAGAILSFRKYALPRKGGDSSHADTAI